jgi:hypothetical protein
MWSTLPPGRVSQWKSTVGSFIARDHGVAQKKENHLLRSPCKPASANDALVEHHGLELP